MPDNLKTQAATAQSAQNAKRDELLLLINSLNPIITVETTEEERLEGLLRSIAVQLVVPLYRWSVTSGLSKLTGAPIYGTDQPEQALANIAIIEDDAIFLLRDFARFTDSSRQRSVTPIARAAWTSRFPVSHCWAARPPPSARWIVGSATFTTVPSSSTIPEPMMQATSVRRFVRASIGVGIGSP